MLQNSEINEKENDELSKGHKCNLCSKSFSGNSLLEQHIEAEHTNEPRFCTFCGKMFKNETYLTQHLLLSYYPGCDDAISVILPHLLQLLLYNMHKIGRDMHPILILY